RLRSDLLEPFLERLSTFVRQSGSLDRSVEKGLAKTRTTVARAVDRLARRYVRMVTERNETNLHRVQYLQNLLFPERMPQERYYSLVSFACRYGFNHLRNCVLKAVDPFDPSIRDVQL